MAESIAARIEREVASWPDVTAMPHHILPESGWVSRRIRGEDDVADVIALFRMNYDRRWVLHSASPRR